MARSVLRLRVGKHLTDAAGSADLALVCHFLSIRRIFRRLREPTSGLWGADEGAKLFAVRGPAVSISPLTPSASSAFVIIICDRLNPALTRRLVRSCASNVRCVL